MHKTFVYRLCRVVVAVDEICMQRTCTQSAPINERCKSSLLLGITSVGSRCGLWEVKVEMCSYEDNCWEKVKSEIKISAKSC